MFFHTKRFRLLVSAAFSTVLISLFTFAAFAGDAEIHFSDPTVDAGSVVNVTMKITADEGTAIGSADIMLSYPTEKLDFISGTDADGGSTGYVRVHGVSNGGGTSTVEYNLSFQTVSAGSASIGIQSIELYDADDDVINITYQGSSAVTINSVSTESSDAGLSLLEVYPGELDPAFSADVDTYALTVGLSVDRLTINADPADSSSTVTISGNDELPEGDSAVTISVTAPDGVSTRVYTINVSKVTGGPESIVGGSDYLSSVEGVQLSSKGKTITIMTPGDDVEIPEGLREGVIKIDDQKVIGWIVDQDEAPEYCVVYGMNESGELNFYRYDLNENEHTIQRYFSDPLVAGSVKEAEYNEIVSERDTLQDSTDFRFLIIVVLAALCFLLVLVTAYLFSRLSSERARAIDQKSKEMKIRRKIRSDAETGSAAPTEDVQDTLMSLPDTEDLIEAAPAPADEMIDETHVIKRSERRRRRRRIDTETAEASELSVDTLVDEEDIPKAEEDEEVKEEVKDE